MKFVPSRHAAAATFVAATLLNLLGARAEPALPTKDPAMTETALTMPQPKADASTVTYCLGRFVIDVPAGSTVSGWGSYQYDFARVEQPVAMSKDQFEKETNALEMKYRATKHVKDATLLRAIERPTPTSVVIAHWEEPTSGGVIKVDAYKWIDQVRFFLRDGAGEGLAKNGKMTKLELSMAGMTTALANLRPRLDTDIPTDPGYCFGGGFIANPEWENEEAAIDLRIADHPDVVVSIDIFPLATRKHDKPLLERMGGAIQQLGKFATGVQFLRKGERDIGQIKGGQEYLVAAPNSGAFRAHSFIWETQGEGTLDTPSIRIEFDSGHQDDKGNPQQTKLSDEQAMKLWDKIVGSFRLRPVSAKPVKTSNVAPPDKPLGELATTGRACPQTGSWECTEVSASAQSSQRHFFEAGDLMPHVVQQAEPSVWQKLKGEAPTRRVATVWKLVSYDPPNEPSKPPTLSGGNP